MGGPGRVVLVEDARGTDVLLGFVVVGPVQEQAEIRSKSASGSLTAALVSAGEFKFNARGQSMV